MVASPAVEIEVLERPHTMLISPAASTHHYHWVDWFGIKGLALEQQAAL